ncbi:AAA family ATPase [Arthrobacter sp. UYCu723]
MTTSTVSDVLIGRAVEVSALNDAIRDPQVRTILLAGEAGIGKSRLVTELSRRLGDEAWILVGRCSEFGAEGVAYAPFLGVMRALVRAVGSDRLAAMLPPQPALAQWLPN